MAAPGAASRWRRHEAYRSAANEQPGTRVRGRGGLEKCSASTTCVRDPTRGERPDGRPDSSSEPGCGPTSGAVHDIRDDRRWDSAKKFLLRDHALSQSGVYSVIAATAGFGGGVRVGLGRVGLWRCRLGGVWLVAAPPASVGPGAGIRRLGSSAGSSVAADICVCSPCAGRAAAAVVADWPVGGSLVYDEGSPRESFSPKGQPGENARTFSPGAYENRQQTGGRASLYFLCCIDQKGIRKTR